MTPGIQDRLNSCMIKSIGAGLEAFSLPFLSGHELPARVDQK